LQNKRKSPRVKAKGVASHLRVEDGLALGLLVENISLGGLFVRTTEPLPLGTPLVLEVIRPGTKKAFKVSGRVVNAVGKADAKKRRVTPGMGIQFDPLSDETQYRLEELMVHLGPASVPSSDDAVNPTQVDLSRRAAFDFGVMSLEDLAPLEPSEDVPASATVLGSAARATAPGAPARAPEPPPDEPLSGRSAASPPAGAVAVSVGGEARLMVQVRGLLLQLGEAHSQLHSARQELKRLNEELEEKNQRIAQLEQKAR
jgi:hypothetical protein